MSEQAQDPRYPSGTITGIQATTVYEEYEGSQTKNWVYLVVSATIAERREGEIELIRTLLGIYEGDERPTVSHWTSTHNGIASGPWLPIDNGSEEVSDG